VEAATVNRWLVGCAGAVAAAALLAGCTSSSSRSLPSQSVGSSAHIDAIGKPFTLGGGYSVLVVAPPGEARPTVTSMTAEKAIGPLMAAQWPGARLVQFGLALVTTNSTDLGTLMKQPAWVAEYSVPANEIPPGSGTQTKSAACDWPTDARADIAAVVDALSGEPGIWNQVPCP
jgi:hypothetical protein